MKKNTKKTTTMKTPQRKVVESVKKDKKIEIDYQYVRPVLKTSSANGAAELNWSETIFTILTPTPTKTPSQKNVNVLSMMQMRIIPSVLFLGILLQLIFIGQYGMIHFVFLSITIVCSIVAWDKHVNKYERLLKDESAYRDMYLNSLKDNLSLITLNKELIDMIQTRTGGH